MTKKVQQDYKQYHRMITFSQKVEEHENENVIVPESHEIKQTTEEVQARLASDSFKSSPSYRDSSPSDKANDEAQNISLDGSQRSSTDIDFKKSRQSRSNSELRHQHELGQLKQSDLPEIKSQSGECSPEIS